MTEKDGVVFSFARKVQLVCGALLALGAVLAIGGAWAVKMATEPVRASFMLLQDQQSALQRDAADERKARQYNDSLLIGQVSGVARAMLYPDGSIERRRALGKVIGVEAWEEEHPAPRRWRRP